MHSSMTFHKFVIHHHRFPEASIGLYSTDVTYFFLNHVMVNHMYALSIQDGVMVMCTTKRFRKKYVTSVLYRPIDGSEKR